MLSELKEAASAPRDPLLRRILVRDRERGRSFFVPVEEIDWLEADGNYVRLHTRDRRGPTAEPHVIRSTLVALEERLDPARFARISRSVVVNLDRIEVFHDWSHGDRLVVLQDGTELKLSRRYRDRLEEPPCD
jgi:two-component system LytT family response regulator